VHASLTTFGQLNSAKAHARFAPNLIAVVCLAAWCVLLTFAPNFASTS